MPSSPDQSSARTWRGFFVSLLGEAERSLRERLGRLKALPLLHRTGVASEEQRLRDQLDAVSRVDASEDEIWAFVEQARHPDRPYTLDYVERMLEDWVELHGDRGRMDDGAIVAGLGKLDGSTVALIGHQKGRDLKERLRRQYGMPSPEGYEKAIRVMELAERFGFPVLTLIDTPGAFPGLTAEQHGQGGAIARSQARMLALGVPTVACVIGEGGSGGALALGVADRVLMQENSIYSVISPEGCAMILWRDREEKKKAAAAFKLDAFHCYELGVVDGIVAEPRGGAHTDPDAAAASLRRSLLDSLQALEGTPPVELRRARRAKFRGMGVFS
jgi:acetyl-CoA carboxylase carboxyl transferase subunit alpha